MAATAPATPQSPQAPQGASGSLGSPSQAGVKGGGGGGNGGNGGSGGTGGDGGTGGKGGGGAGGTIELDASVVDAGATVTVKTSGGTGGTAGEAGENGQLLIGSNTAASVGTQTGVGNLITTTGVTGPDPFIAGSSDTPLIVGLEGGAQTYGLVEPGSSLYNAISPDLQNVPTSALVAVVCEQVPNTAGQSFSNYDLLLFVNLTNMTLAAPQLGVAEGSATLAELALKYDSLANNASGTIQAIPAGGIFAMLVPTNAGSLFVSAALGGSVTDISDEPLSLPTNSVPTDQYITVPFGTQTAGLQLPGLQAVTVSPDGNNVYALSVTDNVLVVANSDNLSQRQTIAVSGLTTASQVVVSPDGDNVYVTEPGAGDVAVFTRNTTTGALTLRQTLSATNVTGALAINAAGTQAILGGSGGLESYTRGSNGSLSSPSAVYQPAGLGAVTDLAFSQDGKDLYAISQSNNAFVVLNPSNLSAAPVASFSGSTDGLEGASAIAVSHDDQYVYVTGETGQTLAVFQRDLSNNTFTWLQTLQQGVQGVSGLAGADGVAVSDDDKYVYVTGQANSLAVFQWQSSGTLLQLVQVQVLQGTQSLQDPGGIAVSSETGVVYVTSQQGLGVQGGGIAEFNLVPPVVITAASWSNDTVTITAANDFLTDQPVTISGITPTGYDGTFTVTSATPTSFTYALATDPGTATSVNGATAVPTARAFEVLFNAPNSGSVTGFGNSSDWQPNGTASISTANDSLTLTTNENDQAGSAFDTTPINTTNGFTATFTYTASGNKDADGVAFVVQDASTGASALGGDGGGLGYSGISDSVAVALNLYTAPRWRWHRPRYERRDQ